MNKREAKRQACDIADALLGKYLEGVGTTRPMLDDDVAKLHEAIFELRDEMQRRGTHDE